MFENELRPGNIFWTINGNMYFVKKDGKYAYLGHTERFREDDNSDALEPRLQSKIEIRLATSIDPDLLWRDENRKPF